ncbi:MAG: hypothetical protein M1831_002518 [Alyxoria varia]|nr:MAG: hypothetical protein M1831_002518 [Alyxoria varia]
MDPGSIAGLVVATAEVITKLHSFARAVRDVPVERAQLQSQLFGLKGVLEHLELVVQETTDAQNSESGPSFARSMPHILIVASENRPMFEPPNSLDDLSVQEVKRSTVPLLKTSETWQMVREAEITLRRLSECLVEHPTASSFKRSLSRLSWPLKREEMSLYISQLDRIKSYLTLVTTMDNHQLGMKIFHEVQDLKAAFREQEGNKKRDALRKAVSDWLSPCDVAGKHHEAFRSKWEGTGKWFVEGHFRPWCNNQQNPLLWLCGRSGSGKTVLLSACIEDSIETAEIHRGRFVLYFYCSVNDHASQSPLNVLGSYIKQLCESTPTLSRRVESLYATAKSKSIGAPNRPSLAHLEETLIQTCRELDRDVIFILDSPNESNLDNEMLSSLLKVINQNLEHSKLLIASTEIVDPAQLRNNMLLSQVDLDHTSIQHDLSIYIWSTLENHKTLGRLPSQFREEISEALVARADGSFRWVQCQLESVISNARSIGDIRESLKNVPQSLERTYTDILLSIPRHDWPIVREILFWLAFAVRPLYLEELAEVAAFSCARINRDGVYSSGPNMSSEYRLLDPIAFVRQCHSLVRCVASEDWIALAHSSVHSYLLSEDILKSEVAYFHMSRGQCLEDVACLCLRYLRLPVFSQGVCENHNDLETRMNEWPLSDYASQYWSEHTRNYLDYSAQNNSDSAVFDSKILKELTLFCSSFHDPGGGNFAAWYEMVFPDGKLEVWSNTHPLYTATREGLVPLVQAILATPRGRGALDRPGGNNDLTPLQVALALDKHESVQVLLDAGADIWKSTTHWRDAVEMTLVFGDTKSKEVLYKHCLSRPEGVDSEHKARKMALMDPATYKREYRNYLATVPLSDKLRDSKYNGNLL